MKRTLRTVFVLGLLLAVCLLAATASAEARSFKSVNEALKYVKENQPQELTIENVKFKPSDLLKIRDAMPEGSEFHFTTTWGKTQFSDTAEDLDLGKRDGGCKVSELEAIVKICPGIKRIDNSKNRSPSNRDMIPLVEKYPDIQFEWIINLGHGWSISTMTTAYTMLNYPGSGKGMNSDDAQLFKYCKRLKALDLGHHLLTNLDFLEYLPDLELLIIGQNRVHDITPIGGLKHLKYAELFLNAYSDISCLANCTELLDLNLTATKVTDLSALDNVQTLERLWVNMCRQLPQEAVDHFKEMHPNCQVCYIDSHAATIDGWRDHPRYDHYIWCFRNHTWIPFDEEIPGKK